MLDQATHIFLLTASGSGAVPVYGPAVDADEVASLSDLKDAKPQARRHRGGAVLSVPVGPAAWCIWLLPTVPKVSDLAQMLNRAQAISPAFRRMAEPEPVPSPAGGVDGAGLLALARRLQRPPRNVAALVSLIGEQLVETGSGQALAVYQPDRRKLWLSDNRLAGQKQVLAGVMARHAATGGAAVLVRLDGEAGDELEARLVLSATGFASLWLGEAAGEPRYIAAVFDAAQPLRGLAAEVASVMQIAAPFAPPQDAGQRARKLAGWALAGIALGAVLLWPVPQKITVVGTAMPADAVVSALPTDANLVAMSVRVGDMVVAGQKVAEFRSQALLEQQAQETLNMTIEALNAQAAMAKNDYGAHQIATQRFEIAKARLAQIEDRIGQLHVTARDAGRIVAALPQNATGAAHPAGTPVVEVQRGAAFLIKLTPSRVDARRIAVGMSGQVYFRGLAETAFGVRIVSPPAVVLTQEGSETLEAIAEVTGGNTEMILSGLAGYARLEGDPAPRVVGMAHYLTEYIRVQAWKFLGLRW